MSKITSQSRPRQFLFTLYEGLDTIKQRITNYFNTKDCQFDKLQNQIITPKILVNITHKDMQDLKKVNN